MFGREGLVSLLHIRTQGGSHDDVVVRTMTFWSQSYKNQLSLEKTKLTLKYFTYRAFHGFGQAKFAYGDSILGASQFTLIPQLPLKRCLI